MARVIACSTAVVAYADTWIGVGQTPWLSSTLMGVTNCSRQIRAIRVPTLLRVSLFLIFSFMAFTTCQ